MSKATLGLSKDKKLVVIVAGSLGSATVNEKMAEYLELAGKEDYEVLYITGKALYEDFIKDKEFADNVKVVPYVDGLPSLLKNTDLKKEIDEIRNYFNTLMKRFEEIEEQNKKRECSKLRDMLLQNYRYYTSEQQNPSKSWTRMEAEAFWELFREYEEAGGNGYMHSVVQPEMERLDIVERGRK